MSTRPLLALAAVLLLLAAGGGYLLAREDKDWGHALAVPDDPEHGPASSTALVLDAQREGRLDRETALLYRALAAYGHPALPLEFHGEGPGEDRALWTEMLDPNLSERARDRLHPFLVRPDHPESVHNLDPAYSIQQTSGTDVEEAFPCDESVEDADARVAEKKKLARQWTSRVSASYPYRVWAVCWEQWGSNIATDGGGSTFVAQGTRELDAQGRIQAAIDIIDTFWGPMTELMGEPLPDLGTVEQGHDSRIDIYIDTLFMRDASTPFLKGGTHQHTSRAMARPSTPCVGYACSGFIVSFIDPVAQPDYFKSALVHEFFHVLQGAHNEKIAFKHNPTWGDLHSEYWFVEASATWAQAHFAPESAPERVHRRFADFQQHDKPLTTSMPGGMMGSYVMYSAYVWPLFMEQEAGARAVAEAWRLLETTDDWEEANRLVASVVPMGERFADFAVRNVNERRDTAIPKLYAEIAPGFPMDDSTRVSLDADKQLAPQRKGAPPQRETLQLPPALAGYARFTATPDVAQVRVRWEAGSGEPSVQALLRAADTGTWTRRELTRGEDAALCGIDEVLFVVANAALREGTEVSLELRPLAEPCSCGTWGDVEAWDVTAEETYAARLDRVEPHGTRVQGDYERTVTLTKRFVESEWTPATGSVRTKGVVTLTSEGGGQQVFEEETTRSDKHDMTIQPDTQGCVVRVQINGLASAATGQTSVAWISAVEFPMPEDAARTGVHAQLDLPVKKACGVAWMPCARWAGVPLATWFEEAAEAERGTARFTLRMEPVA